MCACEHVAVCASWALLFSIEKKSEVQESSVWILLLYTHTLETVVGYQEGHRRRSERQVLLCRSVYGQHKLLTKPQKYSTGPDVHAHARQLLNSVLSRQTSENELAALQVKGQHDRNDRLNSQERKRNIYERHSQSLTLWFLSTCSLG